MFKKVEVWILYLILLIGFVITLTFGVLVRQEIEGITKSGKIDISFFSKPAAYISRIPEKFLMQIFSSELVINDPWKENRDFFSQDGFSGEFNQQESYLLLSRYDGNLKEGVVELVDLRNFEILHTWNPDINKLNNLVKKENEFKNLDRDDNNSRKLYMHPKLTADGGLLFGWVSPLRKVDECSNLIFQNTKDLFHHSIEIDFEGNIWAPAYLNPQTLPKEKIGNSFHDDAIVKLSKYGKVIYEKSVSEIFIENDLEYLLFSINSSFNSDPIHLNDIQPVNFDSEYWKKGDLFLSLRHQSMILLYRPSTNQIVWKGTGPFFQQHDVDIINDHKISIFNNNSKEFINGNIVDGNNEIIIYDFMTKEYSTYLSNSLLEKDVRTINEGLSEILPNGDLFLEESNFARTLYFNADGTLRWSHVNKANDGKVYRVGWSRIMYSENDIDIVKNFLRSKTKCND